MNGPEGRELPTWWTPWSALRWPGRIKRAAAIAFCVFHLGATFAMGAAAEIRKIFTPIFGFYDGRLKMTNTWGMFSKRPTSKHVRIEAIDVRGRLTLVATTHTTDKGLLQRFADGRLRKIQTKLSVAQDRQKIGNDYLDGWCRFAALEIPFVKEIQAVQETHELRDDRDAVTRVAREDVVLRRTCGLGVRPRSLPVRFADDDGGGGDDP